MGEYRKKPVVIEAVQVTAADYNHATRQWDGSPFSDVPIWLTGALSEGQITVCEDSREQDYATFKIETLEGVMEANPGDWIIRGVEGELYPCKAAIFEQAYEPAEAQP